MRAPRCPHLRRRSIIVGQFLGIATLVCASAFAALLALVVPPGWTALLGVVPLALGLQRLVALARDDNGAAEDEDARRAEQENEPLTRSQTLAVASVTVANGGDNLGVYIPLFASQTSAILFYSLIFATLSAVWCWLGYWLATNPLVGERLQRYALHALPFVLIGLGIYILSGALILF